MTLQTSDPYRVPVALGPNQLSGFDPSAITTITAIQPLDSFPVKGEMITAQIEVSDTDLIYSKMPMSDFQKEIKRKLVNLLVEELMNKNHIEFTSQIDPTSNTSKYRVRIYATPDTQVRWIRKNEGKQHG
jgi:hypothetical protein